MQETMRPLLPQGCLSLLLFVLVLILFPFFFADAMLAALARLGLDRATSLLVVLGIFLGGMIDIPVRKIPRDETVECIPIFLFGMRPVCRRALRQRFTVIAVNVGGCIIPGIMVFYQLARIAGNGGFAISAAIVAIVINSAVCYRIAEPIPKVGIALPALVPPFVAAFSGILLFRELAPSIAFCAGVMGALIGADLLHLKDIRRIDASMASIGGAGTFDGIVLSGLLAALLA